MPPSGNASSGVFPLPEPGLKLLFDENLAPRLVTALADIYPGSVHVRDVGLAGTADFAVWEHAGAGGFLLVSKDEDFHRLSVLRGFPPKVVWIRLGNCSTSDIEQILRRQFQQLIEFAAHEEAAFIALG
jgi:predicted nuclease of predicted toxin-antitoxin system